MVFSPPACRYADVQYNTSQAAVDRPILPPAGKPDVSGTVTDDHGKEAGNDMKLYMITGTCGAGKSAMKDRLAEILDPERYA